MKQVATRQLYEYWDGLRRGRSAPERAEIDPSAIRSLLSETFILENDLDHRFPLRLAGSRFSALWCMETKGASFLDLWGRDSHNLAAILLTVMDGATPAVIGAMGAPRGYQVSELELLFLPLRHFGKTHARILGCVACGETPTWLGLLAIDGLRLTSLRFINEEYSEYAPPLFDKIQKAETSLHKGSYFKPIPRPAWLRVYPGGKGSTAGALAEKAEKNAP